MANYKLDVSTHSIHNIRRAARAIEITCDTKRDIAESNLLELVLVNRPTTH